MRRRMGGATAAAAVLLAACSGNRGATEAPDAARPAAVSTAADSPAPARAAQADFPELETLGWKRDRAARFDLLLAAGDVFPDRD